MEKQKTLVILLLLCTTPLFLESRRKNIIPRFKPVSLQAQNVLPTTPNAQLTTQKPPVKPKSVTVPAGDPEHNPNQNNNEEKKDIFLNFESANLKTFANYIGELRKINVIADPKIENQKISLTIRDPLTADGAWNIFLTLLEMSGFSVVKVGDIHKIISNKQKSTEPLPTYIRTPAEKLPDSDITIRYVTMLTNIPINQVKPLLESMLSTEKKVVSYENANGFVITDKSYNIKSAMKVIQELDRSDIKQSVTVMRLKQANANDVKELFKSLMSQPEGHPLAKFLGRQPEKSIEYFPSTTKIIAEQRTNSLILLGDQKSIKRIEDFVVNHVDTELKGVKSPIHIYELQHTDVDQIKDILEAVTVSESDSPAATHGGIRGGVKYFKKMSFATDTQNNRLLVSSADEQDWKLLKRTLMDLDKPQPQVALETLIISVDFTKNREAGSSFRSKKQNQLGRNVNFQAAHQNTVVLKYDDQNKPLSLLGNLMTSLSAGIGSTILSFGKPGDIWGLFRALKSEKNVSVISRPFLLTTNMKESSIEVGETRRVVHQEPIAENDGSAGDAKGYENADASLKLTVKPQINLDGVVTLDIDLLLKEFISNTATNPDTTTKHLTTKVSMANGQVLVLGGFVKTKVTENLFRSPIVSKIPILGWMFKSKQKTVAKEYIFIFMSPTIVKPKTNPGTNLYTKMKLHQAKQDIQDTTEVRTKDPINNWFFNPQNENYSHKIVDFASAKFQPTSVDIQEDPYYRTKTTRKRVLMEQAEAAQEQREREIITITPPPQPPEPPKAPIAQPESPPIVHEEKKPEVVIQEEPKQPEEEDNEEEDEDEEDEDEEEIEDEDEESHEEFSEEDLEDEAEHENKQESPPVSHTDILRTEQSSISNEDLRDLRRNKLKALLSTNDSKPSIEENRRKQLKLLLKGDAP